MARTLSIQRRIRLNTDGNGHRVAVLGDNFVTVWQNDADGYKVWIGVHDKDGRTLRKWRSDSLYNQWHHVTTHKGHIYVTDWHDKLFVYSANGELLRETTLDAYTHKVVCLDDEILVAVSGTRERIVSISHTDYSMEDVLTWGKKDRNKFGDMRTVAVYQDHVAIGGTYAICVYKVHTP